MGEDDREQLRKLKRSFLGYLVGYFLTFSAYLAMLNLQSSINIENGLGTTTLAVTYLFSNIFLILATPILIRIFGVKKCFVLSEMGYLIFVVANLYPEFYTLIPAGLFAGAAEAMLWPCVSLLNVHFAISHSNISGNSTKDVGYYTIRYSGYFFTALQFCQVFGNLVTSSVLYGTRAPPQSHQSPNVTEISSTVPFENDQYRYCGSQDCQDADLVSDSIDQYVPTSRKSIVILISILSAMCIGSQVIHWYVLPRKILQFVSPKEKTMTSKDTMYENECYHKDSISEIDTTGVSTGQDNEIQPAKDDDNSKNMSQQRFWTAYCKTLQDLLQQMKDVKQLLLIPICLYLGSTQAFIFSELTRAYSSCVSGVEMIGIHMATYGVSDAAMSLAVAKFGYTVGYVPFFILSAVMDFGCYMYCLFWVPSADSAWSIYLAFFAFGFSDGIWQTLLNVHLEFFPSNQDIAVTMWSFWGTIGFTLQFAWSTSLCIDVKIFIQLGLLVLGMGCFVLGERCHRREKTEDNMIEETSL